MLAAAAKTVHGWCSSQSLSYLGCVVLVQILNLCEYPPIDPLNPSNMFWPKLLQSTVIIMYVEALKDIMYATVLTAGQELPSFSGSSPFPLLSADCMGVSMKLLSNLCMELLSCSSVMLSRISSHMDAQLLEVKVPVGKMLPGSTLNFAIKQV